MAGTTLGAVLRDMRRRLAQAGIADAATDTRVLAGGLLSLSPTDIVTNPDRAVTQDELERIESALLRRIAREPVHRILGHRGFFGLDLKLSPETLEPRPDTEILVERVLPYLQRIATLGTSPALIDFGTGTGAIALALLSACPKAQAVGVDISAEAVATASENAVRLGLADRFKAVVSDWGADISGTFDLVVSNPPYIVSAVVAELEPEVRLHDPQAALDGGPDGLAAYRALARAIPGLLREGGITGLEIGHDQKDSVTAIFTAAGFSLLEAAADYGGNDRVLIFSKPSGFAAKG